MSKAVAPRARSSSRWSEDREPSAPVAKVSAIPIVVPMSYIDGTAMSILSPTDRAVLWRTVVTSGSEDRGSLLRVLARELMDSIGRRLDLYAGHEDEFIETVALLDASGLIGRDDLREAFE